MAQVGLSDSLLGAPSAPGPSPPAPGVPLDPACFGTAPGSVSCPLPGLIHSRRHQEQPCLLTCLPLLSSGDLTSCRKGFLSPLPFWSPITYHTEHRCSHISQVRVSGSVNQSKALPSLFPSFWVMRGASGANPGVRLKQSAFFLTCWLSPTCPARPWSTLRWVQKLRVP